MTSQAAIALDRGAGLSFVKEIRGLVGRSKKNLKFHEEVDGEFIFWFKLSATVTTGSGRVWPQLRLRGFQFV